MKHMPIHIIIRYGADGNDGPRLEYGTNDRAVVATRTVKLVALPAAKGMGFGVAVQAAPAGAPEHAIVTFPE